ncbi:hypothetical protein BJY16_000430 [Actinoplanes octamycinicus]|uniref:YcxB-like protein n=1 Tax=Actinoplanes octamycinicus TaxID=135948 RepID=A0A7W7GRH7_9ACTN|nr:YcxB family protein [Actinoplanes octamycinicus]MBB4736971.1 hypothetical protein [Actinoplanes octamycinicus]GIE62109.1 hypothetical protein Aoc01nite_75110 [Actinoplanes octamycinicus]
MTSDVAFTFAAEPDLRRFRVALAHFYRPSFLLVRTTGVLLIAVAGFLLLLGGRGGTVAGLLLGAVFLLLAPAWIVRRTAVRVAELADRPATYRVDGEGIRVSSDLIEQLYRWPALTTVAEVPGILLATTVGAAGFVAVPTDGLTPEDAAALTAFVRARVGGA